MLCALVLGLLLGAPAPSLQDQDHPGQVHLGNGEWGTPDEARERGLMPWGDRWVPRALEKDLKKWEREDAKGLAWEDAYKTKSKYYRIHTNVPRWRVELEIKPFLDALFETYERVFAEDFGLSGKAAANKDIRIYDGFNAYSVNEPDDGKPRPRSNPGFIVGGASLVVYYEETDPGVFYSTVFHEGAHQFFLSLLPGATPPHWMTEALATYFEGCTYARTTNTITPGFVSPMRLEVVQSELKSGRNRSAEELFLDVGREEFGGEHYAYAWSFVHYLIHRSIEGSPPAESRARFGRFVRELNGSGAKPVAEVFAQATGEDLQALLPGWRAHVLALKAPPELEWAVLFVARATPAEDLRSRDLAWSIDGVVVRSVDHFNALWKSRPRDRAYEVVVVRCEPDFHSPESTRRFVRVTVPLASDVALRAQGKLPRHGALTD